MLSGLGRTRNGGRLLEHDNGLTVMALAEGGACVSFERGMGGATSQCAIHRVLGHDALPSACRHFPRAAVTDDLGTFVTLSHFCPTAASMLFRDDVELSMFTTLTTFGTPQDITLSELAVELFFPADEASDTWLRDNQRRPS